MRRAIDFSKHKRKGSSIFLSTPSARRATGRIDYETHRRNIFLSTPSARRATQQPERMGDRHQISIHALREEGDQKGHTERRRQAISIHALREEGDSPYRPRRALRTNFYPRPPRGGRLFGRLKQRRKKPISIHALREEGDRTGRADNRQEREFLSTPSARRATTSMAAAVRPRSFLSTPSARRATSVPFTISAN